MTTVICTFEKEVLEDPQVIISINTDVCIDMSSYLKYLFVMDFDDPE